MTIRSIIASMGRVLAILLHDLTTFASSQDIESELRVSKGV